MTKFEVNVRRDHRQQEQLRALGWKVITVWECELRAASETVIGNLRETLSASKSRPPARLQSPRKHDPHR
jgi:G:T-mismatch repair DNA endonuclease (very short patch repair protein)